MVEQQRAIIIAYEKYYKDQNKLIDQSNENKTNTSSTTVPESKPWWKVW